MPKLVHDENGNLVFDINIDETIYETEQKILNRLEKREKKGKNFDYGIDNIRNYSDFSKMLKKYRIEKAKEDYLAWLNFIEDATE